MNDKEANNLRLIANEIMHKLWKSEKRSQLDILRNYATTAISKIDIRSVQSPPTES